MKRTLFATLLLLLCSVWALAQQSYPSGQESQTSSSRKATVQGCLNRSGSGYTLTDQSGTTYQLTGDTSQLSAHVGHEIQITGTKAASSPPAGAPPDTSNQTAQSQFEVSSMKHISESCTSAPDKSSEKPPDARK